MKDEGSRGMKKNIGPCIALDYKYSGFPIEELAYGFDIDFRRLGSSLLLDSIIF